MDHPLVGGCENTLPNRLKELAILKGTPINGCVIRLAHHYHAVRAAGVSMVELPALHAFAYSSLFLEKDRAAPAHTEEITANNRHTRGQINARLKANLPDPEIVNLTAASCMFNFLNRFNHCLEAELDPEVPAELVRTLEEAARPALRSCPHDNDWWSHCPVSRSVMRTISACAKMGPTYSPRRR